MYPLFLGGFSSATFDLPEANWLMDKTSQTRPAFSMAKQAKRSRRLICWALKRTLRNVGTGRFGINRIIFPWKRSPTNHQLLPFLGCVSESNFNEHHAGLVCGSNRRQKKSVWKRGTPRVRTFSDTSSYMFIDGHRWTYTCYPLVI